MAGEGASLRAWGMLALGVAAQAAGTVLVSTPAFLLPHLHAQGMSLVAGGALAAAPTVGLVLTMVLWGALADRFGERIVIAAGLGLSALVAALAIGVADPLPLGILLLLGGATSASVNAASGRVVIGWFPRERRGLAMGVRQIAQPLGVSVAAILVPILVDGGGIAATMTFSAVLLGVLAVLCALGIRNPPRKPAGGRNRGGGRSGVGGSSPGAMSGNPYRSGSFLWRIHAVSALLVVPQFALSIFGVVWLVTDLGWDATAAGVLVAAAQFIGALGRILIGAVSDRVGSRVRVLRAVSIAGAVAMLAVGGAGLLRVDAVAAIVFVIATVVSVADNGVAFTSVAEAAGGDWAGRALGVQNTGQYLVASAVGPVVGALIGLVGAPWAFALLAVAPALARPLVPADDRFDFAGTDELSGPSAMGDARGAGEPTR
ncbi:MFS family permease [Microbacterium resistens]|uniref:MFS family permease n=1 Tax=Microbacterium resistens TaxID=156977 RepID=A0ABU1SAK1_9MICO|nr:MFS transporter [Microbacterium resistens]MDR6866642.1 MFS family permease [Microbacterium resistens]